MQYDAIVIGASHGGLCLADRMNAAGMRLALVEPGGSGAGVDIGGSVRALVASARAAHLARRAAEFGVVIDGAVRVDMARATARAREMSDQSSRSVREWIGHMENVGLYHGHARFIGQHAIEVGGERLEAEKIIINVGARPLVPQLAGLDEVGYLTSSSALALDVLPRHLIVVGASYVGVELAQVFRRFGSQVTIIERGPCLLNRDDPDVSACVQEILESEGVRVRCHSRCLGVVMERDGIAVDVTRNGSPRRVAGSHVLIAVGQTPSTDSLRLDAAGIGVDAKGYIAVDDRLRTSAPGIWALGGCTSRSGLAYMAHNDFEVVAADVLGDESRTASDYIQCQGLFIDPPLGRIGMTEAEARTSGRRVLVGRWPMSNVARARERSEMDGFIKILVDADSEQILGASILGISGDEVVHSLLDAMYAEVPYTVISRASHLRSTVSESIPMTLQNLTPLE